jgi:hypothetical protein
MTSQPDQPAAAPDTDDIVALIDPKNEVAIRAVLALKHRLEQVELEQVVYRSFLNDHEDRIRKLEAMLTTGGTAN